ncbi:spore-wall fungal hydrophobin dewA [Aspergillus desertorum]
MQLIGSLLGLTAAAAASALPASAAENSKLVTAMAFAKQTEGITCSVGSIACCNSPEKTNNDSLLSNTGSACAKASLIDQLGLLALVDHTETGPVCKNIVACCPEGTTTCVAADTAGHDSK